MQEAGVGGRRRRSSSMMRGHAGASSSGGSKGAGLLSAVLGCAPPREQWSLLVGLVAGLCLASLYHSFTLPSTTDTPSHPKGGSKRGAGGWEFVTSLSSSSTDQVSSSSSPRRWPHGRWMQGREWVHECRPVGRPPSWGAQAKCLLMVCLTAGLWVAACCWCWPSPSSSAQHRAAGRLADSERVGREGGEPDGGRLPGCWLTEGMMCLSSVWQLRGGQRRVGR